MMNMCKKILG